uniref:Capsid protein n=1 Tax=Grus japonensis CRESS-DNA-virus sp. TaxID=2815045 RepID=A0A8A4XB13_9VIRU|nr:MAG: capsid protein [Grus japonensis CRESS-DNA-virus sp.]
MRGYRRTFRRRSVRRPVRRRRWTKFPRRTKYRRYGLQDKYAATSSINRGGTLFRKKPFNPRVWRRRLQSASDASPHYRSNNALPFSFSSALVIQQAIVHMIAMVPDAGGGNRFWETAGGLVRQDNLPLATDFGGGDLFLRGGKCNLSLVNNTTVLLKIRVWKGKTTENGTFLSTPSVAVADSWDPSLPTDLLGAQDTWRLYKIFWNQEYLLKPTEGVSLTHYLRARKIDQDSWINLRSREFWIVSVQNLATNAAVTMSAVSASWNLSFSADRIA